MDLMKLMDEYGSEGACREVLAELRWPEGVKCPRCVGERHAYDSARYVWDCYSCGYQFSALSGTIFHDTKLPLRKWLVAVYLMCEARKGVSANQMKRTLGVSYKTAWYLCHRIRAAMGTTTGELLVGVIEADETFVGGKPRYTSTETTKWGKVKAKPYSARKTVVLGALERGGNVRLRVAPDRSGASIRTFIDAEVADEATHIYSDDWKAYRSLADEDTLHASVNHSEKEWVRGDVHTNGIESVWSLLKRAIIGSYHHTSVKHLQSYLDEMEWRFNNRNNEYLFRDTLTQLVSAEAMPYQELIAPA